MTNFAQNYSLYGPAQHSVGHRIHLQNVLTSQIQQSTYAFILLITCFHLPLLRKGQANMDNLGISKTPSALTIWIFQTWVLLYGISKCKSQNNKSNPSKIVRLMQESQDFFPPTCCLCIMQLLCALSQRIKSAPSTSPFTSCVSRSSSSIPLQFKGIFCSNSEPGTARLEFLFQGLLL